MTQRVGDVVEVTAPGESTYRYRVTAVEPATDGSGALNVTLQRETTPAYDPAGTSAPGSLAEALDALAVPSIAVGPLAEKLEAYGVKPVTVAESPALFIGHDPCNWSQVISGRLETSLTHLLALALEHHLAGCRNPR